MNKSNKTSLHYNISCSLFAANRPFTVFIFKSRHVYLGELVLSIIYTPAKRMFPGVYWNQPVSLFVQNGLIHKPLNEWKSNFTRFDENSVKYLSSPNILHRVICKRWDTRSTGFVCMFAIYICVKGGKSSFYQTTAASSHLVFSIFVFTGCAIWMRSDIQNLSLTNGHRFPEFFSIEWFFISGCSWARQIYTIHTFHFCY